MKAFTASFLVAGQGLALISATSSCSSKGCLAVLQTVVSVSVRDESTKNAICDATVVITKGAGYKENAIAIGSPSDCHFVGGNAPGTYEIQVSRAGYQTITTPVAVPASGDNPNCPQGDPQSVTVDLRPSG